MKIEYLDPKLLTPYKKNAKTHPPGQIKKIVQSINTYGFRNPIRYITHKKQRLIVAGHGRQTAAIEIGLKTIPVIKLDMSYEQALPYMIADNRTAESPWDENLLHDIFLELEEMDIDLDATGFSVEEREVIHNNIDPQEPIEPPTPPLPDKPVSKLGDIYQLGKHRLMCGDSTTREDVERLMDGQKADLVFTDPPYGINIVNSTNSDIGAKVGFKKGKVGAQGLVPPGEYEKIKGDDKPFDPEIILTLSNKIILFGANNYASKLPDNSHWIVWDKKCEIGKDKNNFSDVELAWTNIKRKSCVIYRYLWSGLLREGDRKTELKKRVHPTQKPVGLCADILKDYSKKNNTVIDLYGGSGSILIACEETNRICYMMEISRGYCDVIVKRWEDFTGKTAVLIPNKLGVN